VAATRGAQRVWPAAARGHCAHAGRLHAYTTTVRGDGPGSGGAGAGGRNSQANDNGDFGLGSGNCSAAAGFTLPAGSAYTLGNVTLRLATRSGGTAKVELFGDVGGNPGGQVLDTFTATGGSFGTQPGDLILSPDRPFTLQPDTTYWLSVTNPTGGLLFWWASSPPTTPTGIAASAGYREGNTDPPTGGAGSAQGTYSVEGTPLATGAPEPASLTLLGVGALGLLGYGWRKR
jgi:hypothetical protein